MQIAVLMKDGFEELEALGIIDIARRLNVECDIIGFGKEYVVGSHGVHIQADRDIEDVDTFYDALVLPGGPASTDLRDDPLVIDLIQQFDKEEKIIGAICAAPIALERAGVIKGKRVTSYPSVREELTSCKYDFSTVQVDGRIITGNGPAATFAFAFAVMEALGVDTSGLKEGMQYNHLMSHK